MEAHEIAEKIHEHHADAAAGHESSHENFRRFAAIYVGVVAMLLAIASLGSAEAGKEMLNANIHASDTYAFYQAKYIRQTSYEIAARQMELMIAGLPGVPEEDAAKARERIQKFHETATRYESDPSVGNGKKELLERAHKWEHRRDHAAAQTPNFEYAEALYQIAIVLGSVSIVAASSWLLGLSAVLSIGGVLLTLNGYLLLVPLPHG